MVELLVRSRDVEIFTESVGDPKDPAVLLIMGAMSSGVWWPVSFCEQLAARGRFVIRYDHRDTGRTTSYAPGETRYTVEKMAEDALAVVDAYGFPAAHLVGMSLGGMLAQLAALKGPECVRTLTFIASERLELADPDIPGMDERLLEYHRRAASLDWTDHAAVIDYQVGAWRMLGGPARPFDEPLIRALAEEDWRRTPNPLTPFNHAGLTDSDAWVGRLHEIHAPVLIIHGTHDPVLPYAHGLALQAAFPNSRLVTLEGAGHELNSQDWPVILDEIVKHTGEKALTSSGVARQS